MEKKVGILADNIISPLGDTTEQNYLAVKAGHTVLCRYEGRWNIPEPFTASLFTEEQNQALSMMGLTRFESLACSSAKKAILDSGIDVRSANVVFILSTTKGNIELISNPLEDDSVLYPGTAALHIVRKLGIKTLPITVCNACISGVSAIILAHRLLEARYYDYAVVCGADVQSQFTVSGFQSLKAMSEDECKPFDIERLGLNLGEAAATVVLARKMVGDDWMIESGAVRNDAFHISSPSKNGEGARLVLNAITNHINREDLAFINAHGTATMFNDQMESVAIDRAGLQAIPVNALKGFYGHTLGAAGVMEMVLSMAATDDHTILATRGFGEIGVSGKIHVVSQNRHTEKQSFIKMISGFGGCNGAVLVSKGSSTSEAAKPVTSTSEATEPVTSASEAAARPLVACYRRDARKPVTPKHHVRIIPSGLWVDDKEYECSGEGSQLLTDIYKRYINNYPKYYKMDGLSRLGFVASELLLMTEGAHDVATGEERAVVLFNRTSSIQADRSFQESIADPEDFFPSPSAFVYTLPNIVAGEIAIRHHYNGETSFYILPEKDEDIMQQIIKVSFNDPKTQSILGGWVDYQDDFHYEADLYLLENK